MRKVYADQVTPSNVALKMSFYNASQGYVAFKNWVGYTSDSGLTFIPKPITTSNVNFGSYNVNITFGFTINGVKAFSQNTLLVYGDYGFVPSILRSTDGGNSFTLIFHSQHDALELKTGITDMIFPKDVNIGYAVDADRILKTTNGGQTWIVNYVAASGYFDRIEAVDNSTVYTMSLSYLHQKLLRTTNGGLSWSSVNLPAPNGTTTLKHVYFLNAVVGWLCIESTGDEGYIYKTSNAGSTWVLQNDPLANPFISKKMRFIDANTGYALCSPSSVYKTSNGGILWEPLPRDNAYAISDFNDLHFYSTTQFWAGGGHIELTTNGGGTVLPKAYFKIDTTGATLTNTVQLLNVSNPSYSCQWLVNGALVSNAYTATYTHDVYRLKDTIQLVVSNGAVMDTLTKYQFYYDPVVITSFTPTSGIVGTQVMISGINFYGVQAVKFGDVNAGSYTVLSPTSIRAFVGTGASGTVSVKTGTGYGTKSGFTFFGPPTISSFSPTSAAAGTLVSISGNGFTNTSSVVFAGVPASSFTVVSPTLIHATAPSGGGGSLSVTTPNGTATLAGYSVKPTVTLFTPLRGTQGTVLTIKGTSLVNISGITVGGVPVQSFTNNSKDSSIAVIAAGASGSVILSASGGSSSLAGFTWVAPPVIQTFSPATGLVGATVNITGTGFNPVASGNNVRFGSVSAVVLSATTTSMAVIVPTGAGTDMISISNNDLIGYSRLPFIVTFPDGGSITENTFASPVIFNNPEYRYDEFKVSDFDNDGKLDIVFLYGYNTTEATSGVLIYKNTSTGAAVSFAEPIRIPGSYRALATGDLDADGKTDLVLSISYDFADGALNILRNTSSPGTISFFHETTLPLAVPPKYIAIGDVDLDGKSDIVSGGSLIFRNISNPGKYAFAPGVSLPGLHSGKNIVLADLTGDTKPEIILADGATGTAINILKNNSTKNNITFSLGTALPHFSSASSYIAAADMDGDGKTDLVAGDRAGSGVYIYRNIGISGNVAFSSRIRTDAVNEPGGVALADYDGDGKIDIAAKPISTSLAVLKNNSLAGSMEISSTINYGPEASDGGVQLAAADINSDGKTDIITFNPEARTFYIHLNKVKAEPFIRSFTPTIGEAGTVVLIKGKNFTGATAVLFGSINAASLTILSDTIINATVVGGSSGPVFVTNSFGTGSKAGFVFGLPPIITSLSATSGPVGSNITINGARFSSIASNNIVLYGSIRATVTTASATALTIIIPPGPTHQVISVTVNQLTAYTSQPFNTTFSGADATISGSNFAPPVGVLAELGYPEDIDGDGKLDMVSFGGVNKLFVSRNTGSIGNFSFAPQVEFSSALAGGTCVFGDLDGDGKRDIITPLYNKNLVMIWKNNSTPGNILLSFAGTFATGNEPNTTAVQDLDGDGKPEIVTGNQNLTISILKNISASGSIFMAGKIDYSAGGYVTGSAIRDIDGDGKQDLIFSVNASEKATVFRNLSVPGTLNFADIKEFSAGPWPSGVDCGDLDGDGYQDIAVSSYNSTNLYVYRNNSTLNNVSMQAPKLYAAGASPSNILIGDVDGDGRPEMIMQNTYTGGVGIFKNKSSIGNVNFGAKFWLAGNDNYLGGLADMDGDGLPDMIVNNNAGLGLQIHRNMTSTPLLDKALCIGGSVTITSSVIGASYRWQLDRDNGLGFVNINNGGNYGGVTTATLQLIAIPTTFANYRYRCITPTGSSTNTVLRFVNSWTGAISNVWSEPGNWSCGSVPDANTDVVITSGNVLVNSNSTCRSLNLYPAVTFTIAPGVTLVITH